MNIVIIDDHEITRNSIRKLLNRIDSSYIVVGEAEDGLNGIELIRSVKPELVIADIKMPNMTGIEMIEVLKNQSIHFKSILLSGFAEFESAQKALSLGISHYLLKPITAEDLSRVLDQINQIIEREKFQQRNLIRNYVLDICNRKWPGPEEQFERNEMPSMNFPGIDLINENYQLIIMHSIHISGGTKVSERFSDYLDQHEEIIFIKYNEANEIILLIPQKSLSSETKAQREFVKAEIYSLIDAQTVKMADDTTNLLNLDQTLTHLRKLLKSQLVAENHSQTANGHRTFKRIDKKILAALETHNYQEAISEVAAELDTMIMQCSDPDEITTNFTGLLLSCINLFKDQNPNFHIAYNQSEALQQMQNAISKTEIMDGFNRLFALMKQAIASPEPVYSLIVTKTIRMIKEQFTEDLNLATIAQELKITPEYLSALFSKETGKNFSLYVRGFRIEKAKLLLTTTNLKTYEIAAHVGYSDVKYFCNIFKKVTGYSTRDYVKLYK